MWTQLISIIEAHFDLLGLLDALELAEDVLVLLHPPLHGHHPRPVDVLEGLVVLQQTVPQDEAKAVQRVVFLFHQSVV